MEITAEVPEPVVYPRGGTSLTGQAAVSSNPPGFEVCWPNPWNFSSNQAALTVEQENTGLFLDNTTKQFKAEPECTSPFIYLQQGIGLRGGSLTLVLDTPFDVWTDGFYLIRFYDCRLGIDKKVCFNVGELWIYNQTVLPSMQAIADQRFDALSDRLQSVAEAVESVNRRVNQLPVDWQIAQRTLAAKTGDAHNTVGTVGRWINDVKADLTAIKQKLGI